MLPSDAYEHKIKQYHSAVHQAEQLNALHKDSRFQSRPFSVNNIMSNRLQRGSAPQRYRFTPVARTYLLFTGLLLAFTLLVIVAYA
jgi:hypothetical protein